MEVKDKGTTGQDFVIIERGGKNLPKITGRGRPTGSGCNMRLLHSMNVGDSAWGLSWKKMTSVRMSAHDAKIKIRIRKIPETETYAIQRLT